jgi:general secretion pathway protein D
MTMPHSQRGKLFACLFGFLLFAAALAEAQFFPGGSGGGAAAGRTGAGGGRGASASTRQYYPPGDVGEAMITADPETRRLIVITDDETSQYVGQVITNLDRPKPQVLIKVVFLEVTYRNSSDIGIEGAYRRNINGATVGAISNLFGLTPGLPGGQGASPIPPGAGLYQLISSDYQVTLRAIAEAGKLEVLSRPSILARNNQQAIITVGQSVPLITNVRFDTFGNAINSVSYQNVGIILRVTPFITSDNMVEMIVAPEISSLSEQSIPISTGASAPVIDLRSADTVVVTPDAQPVIIGGLMQNNKTTTDSKIPVLGDIPLLGNLFKRKVKSQTKTELMIFLTPHIVMNPTELAGIYSREKARSEMAPKAFSEKELNRFLDDVPAKQDSDQGPAPKTP